MSLEPAPSSSSSSHQPTHTSPIIPHSTLTRRTSSADGSLYSIASLQRALSDSDDEAQSARARDHARSQSLGRTPHHQRSCSEVTFTSESYDECVVVDELLREGAATPTCSSSSSAHQDNPNPATSTATGNKGGLDDATQANEEGKPELDGVLLAALSQARDRLLLLRAEAVIQRFIRDDS